ncbi:MAG TPA: hypothetical protein VN892_00915 [Solirubrobacteraceae bacterium]|nr:hypothetical protein [Solirubrobacteraceae bacterium]
MASNLSPPPDGTPGEPSELASEDQPVERFGPVAIERLVKEDGRALILYSQLGHRSHA